jgi:hypothetical protein
MTNSGLRPIPFHAIGVHSARRKLEATMTMPPRDPNQVPETLKDDIGKHQESDFNEAGDEADDWEEGDDETSDFE